MSAYTNQYLVNTVNSASPEQLMLMLYDGAIRFLSQGIISIENGMLDKRAYFINKASAIISEFSATLDRSQDAELADNLDALYGYMLNRLLDGNKNNDTEALIEVKNMLSDLRSTWGQAIERNKLEKSGRAATAYPGTTTDTPSPEEHKSIATAM
ncbi:MAG: flagellar export chaperone FliS [Desulfobulbus propionicus]|nr:MAG: flagellar export chaperone FliS [Desulfobulbus propionicus]PIE60799.1 MAG: flagellar export chaperone FliS [Desulfobulbus propionicus]